MGEGKAAEMGLKLKAADVKDTMFPGEMKKALRLRALQAFADSGGGMLVWGVSGGAFPLEKRNRSRKDANPEEQEGNS